MTTLEDSKRAFDHMAETARALIADPTNEDKIQAARIATAIWRSIHRTAMQDAGFPEHLCKI
jgi:hypothetical protein